jgi:cytochrome c-type biogenesis protein CcmH
MSRRIALLCVLGLWLCASAMAIESEAPLADPSQRELYDSLVHEVRCLVCQNQTIGDSTAPLAADLRREIRRLVEEGQSEEQIKRFLIERYGDFVLYQPRLQGSTLALWAAPVVLLVIGAIVLVRVTQRRARLPADIDADAQSTDRRTDRE